MGCGPPPMLGTPDKHEKNPQIVVVGWFQKIVAAISELLPTMSLCGRLGGWAMG